MPMNPPSADDLAAAARHFHLHPSASELDVYRDLVGTLVPSYDRVEELYRERAPQAPADRTYRQPAPEENPLGAWYARTEISSGRGGVLSGRSVVLKDNVSLAGVPMTNGSATLAGFVPSRDATVATRLLDAGATIVGKSVCEDLCMSGSSHTSSTGPVRNPWDRTRITGGSSSGSAALVASGEVDLAIGGDQGGSIRMPAAFCGIVGHKPTHGLVPYTGVFPIENTIDHTGPMTRTVADAAVMLGVLAGPDGLDPRQYAMPEIPDYAAGLDAVDPSALRIGVLAEGFGHPDLSQPEVDAAVREAVAVLERAGAKVTEVEVPWHRNAVDVWTVIATDGTTAQMLDGKAFGLNWSGRYDPELIAHYAQGLREHADEMSPTLKRLALQGHYSLSRYDGRHYAMARNLVAELTAAYDRVLADVDVLVMPTVPYTAVPIPAPDVSIAESVAVALGMLANTAPFDITGHPAISVPAGLVDGLPVGMMLVGRRFADLTCLQVAHAYETAVGGFPAPPA